MAHGYAAQNPGEDLQIIEYDLGPLGPTEVDIAVEYCGICQSDIGMIDNTWGVSSYPIVPGHEVIGIVRACGDQVSQLNPGQRVGVGWNAGSCMHCEWCNTGEHNLCASVQGTIVGRHGGFADQIRAAATWTFPIPSGLRPEVAGPLLCGGITVFNPIVQYDIQPGDRVGVIGIGGLGHLALQFLQALGCEVTAFSSSPEKEDEARKLGADHFFTSIDTGALSSLHSSLDFILSTVDVSLDWETYLHILCPKGRLHLVGSLTDPMTIPVGAMLLGQKSISASPDGSPATVIQMLEFAECHNIEPIVEIFPLTDVNEALERVRHGKPRYRVVLRQ
ncbi:MAG: NAD(P)-dependent alcohol dehydrogenase [Gammaproteobacteria bacterium]|nr:MAG: NAD(P)-dependent alcohol dehydrogenase [Gammaproteobacteria bacterium]